ncbi:MAG TPA: flagellar motor switch protein FliY [Campylobacterales bacterium]|nr:flagellar motor switch protein FliY [Campylobacterales bacterium]
MTRFLDILTGEVKAIVEGLTGYSSEFTLDETLESDLKTLQNSARVDLSCESGNISFFMGTGIATALGDLMLGGTGEEKESLDEDDIDATKEIVSNIFGSLTTTLSAQEDMPSLSFEVVDIGECTDEEELDSFLVGYRFKFIIEEAEGKVLLFCDKDFLNNFKLDDDDSDSDEEVIDSTGLLSIAEMKNISLIMDVQLPVRVRIGTKTILLKDILKMDIGSVVELDQLANRPLDILVGDKIIAQGEVVIVDGNFGVQIVDIGTKEERLAKIR